MTDQLEANKELVVRFYRELFDNHNLDIVDELWSESHSPTRDMLTGTPNESPDATKAYIQELLDAFPDMSIEFEHVVAEDNLVVVRWIKRGTHTGSLKGIPPSDEEVEWTGFALVRVEDGKIQEGVSNWDTLGVLQQIGAAPSLTAD